MYHIIIPFLAYSGLEPDLRNDLTKDQGEDNDKKAPIKQMSMLLSNFFMSVYNES